MMSITITPRMSRDVVDVVDSEVTNDADDSTGGCWGVCCTNTSSSGTMEEMRSRPNDF